MRKEKKGKHFIQKAFYKGGSKALTEFVLGNLKYPQEAWDNKIEGTVHARYDINHRGKVTKVHIMNSLGHGCDKEAIRLIKLLEFEVPKTRGLRLTFHKTIHIHFRMPKKTAEPQILSEPISPTESTPLVTPELTVNYEIKPTVKPKSTNNKSGYSYTVDL